MITGILDVSHWEYDSLKGKIAPALAKAKAAGIVAVIAKATQGKDYVDPSWPKWSKAIRDAGLLLGAYHFGSNTSAGDAQADWFKFHVTKTNVSLSKTLLVLDFERNPKPSATMTLDGARAFLHRLGGGMLYGDSSFLSQITNPDDVLGEFPLWIAAYGPSVPKIPRAWRGPARHGYTLFQYTNGVAGPSNLDTWPRLTAGFGRIHRSAFQGTEKELRARWPFSSSRNATGFVHFNIAAPPKPGLAPQLHASVMGDPPTQDELRIAEWWRSVRMSILLARSVHHDEAAPRAHTRNANRENGRPKHA